MDDNTLLFKNKIFHTCSKTTLFSEDLFLLKIVALDSGQISQSRNMPRLKLETNVDTLVISVCVHDVTVQANSQSHGPERHEIKDKG